MILGRDHYPDCFTMWMAGGGVKAGLNYGQTDELGFGVVENKVQVYDLQATIMHLLGFDHERLTFRFQGRDYRLTDVHGHVVHDLLAVVYCTRRCLARIGAGCCTGTLGFAARFTIE